MKRKPIIACSVFMLAAFISGMVSYQMHSIIPLFLAIAFFVMCALVLGVCWGEISDWEQRLEEHDRRYLR